MKLSVFISASMLLTAFAVGGVDYTPKYEIVNKPEFPTLDLPVITYNVTDYGVDPTGKKDCTSTVQAILDAAAGVGDLKSINGDSSKRGWYGNITGGVVYFPEGTYLFNGTLTIPRGVTIRGDWKKPEAGTSTKGTVFAVQPTRGAGVEIEASSFIIMQPSTEVNGITFWYPDQKPGKITKYPPTVLYGQAGYFGNDYLTVQHCTFLNSYTAIKYSSTNGGGCPDVFDVYGTPLSQGVVIDNIADVGRLDGLYFNSSYWEDCGLAGAPAKGEVDSWLYNNAIGVVMRRNDWTYTCNLFVDGYNVGFHAESSPAGVSMEGNPNGHNYRLRLNNCHTGVKISGASNSGIMFGDVETPGCAIGLEMPASVKGPIQVQGSVISGKEYAILMGEACSPGLQMQLSTVKGVTEVWNGQFSSVNSTFEGDVNIGQKARTIFVGNKVTKGSFHNSSLFECEVNSTPLNMRPLPVYKNEWMERKTTRPARVALYVVTEERFGAQPVSIFEDLKKVKDNTEAIQKALTLAGQEGGGIVYLPSGHYRVDGTLTIPSGVELKGSGDLMTTPRNNGAILESFHGEGNANAAPFITMEKGSGLRGLTINYPNQTSPVNVKVYPYSVRGNADTYICNLALRTAYKGVDLFTNKCDNHYVDYLAGHAFMNVIRVGNGSENGIISNIQCNTIAYACGDETKFGCWPNSESMKDDSMSHKAYGQNSEDLDFMIIGDSKDEVLYNNFLFGCHQGMIFTNDGKGGAQNVHSLGNAVDGAVETFVFNGGDSDIDLINSQVVALNHDKEDEYVHQKRLSATFVLTDKAFKKTATFFSGNFWGGGDCLINCQGGTVNLYSANLAASGSVKTLQVADGAKVGFINVDRRQGQALFSQANKEEKNVTVEASVINCNSANESKFSKWAYNLPTTWEFSSLDNLLPRTGWKATAFNDVNGTGMARSGIDNSSSSRWSTEGPQKPGQWYEINFGRVEEFNTLILDASSSPNDGPAAYKVEVYEEGTGWHEVASGDNGSATLIVTFEDVKASRIKITQTGTASGYWSIHEAYIANLDYSGVEEIAADANGIYYADDTIWLAGEAAANPGIIGIYDLSGRLIDSAPINDSYTMGHLPKGIYVVEVRTGNRRFVIKICK